MSGGPAGGGMSGGGMGLMSGGGLSIGSGGRGISGREGCSIMRLVGATSDPFTVVRGLGLFVRRSNGDRARASRTTNDMRGFHTSSPTARISASALLRSTTPDRMR